MKRPFVFLGALAVVPLVLMLTACPPGAGVGPETSFVPVTDITGVPTAATAGTSITLTGTVVPDDATNQTIEWSVRSAGTTGAALSGAALAVTDVGTVTVTATITNGLTAASNYTKDFTITVSAPAGFNAVTDITGVSASATVGLPLTLGGTVVPSYATNNTIAWSVASAGETGAVIADNIFTAASVGTATVTATIANGLTESSAYTKNFDITVIAYVAVTNITGVPTAATAGAPLTLTGTVAPADASAQTIVWTVKTAGTTGASITGNTFTATAAGTADVTATITNGLTAASDFTKDFTINVAPFVPVTNITGVPTGATAGTPLALTGTVAPADAVNKTIVWSVTSAGGTGAAINGTTFTATAAGTAAIRATIINGQSLTPASDYTKDFYIDVSAPGAFIPVSNITGVPAATTEGVSLTLSGTVVPNNASNKNIVWSVIDQEGTGAAIGGTTFTAPNTGTAIVRATITNGWALGTDYTQDFPIVVKPLPVGVQLNSTTLELVAGGTAQLTATVTPAGADQGITWSSSNSANVTVSPTGRVQVIAAGGATITAASTAKNTVTAVCTVTVEAGAGIVIEFEGFGDQIIDITGDEYKVLSLSANTYLGVGVDDIGYPLQWYLDGQYLFGATHPFIWAGSLTLGTHYLTTVYWAGGVPYSKELRFKVVL
jgi:endo-1,4-beta-xylanase